MRRCACLAPDRVNGRVDVACMMGFIQLYLGATDLHRTIIVLGKEYYVCCVLLLLAYVREIVGMDTCALTVILGWWCDLEDTL
jgi:hypothetical protein